MPTPEQRKKMSESRKGRSNGPTSEETCRKISESKKDIPMLEETKIKIICPTHGTFEQSPATHLKNHGCSKCGNKNDLKTFLNKSNIKASSLTHPQPLADLYPSCFRIFIR